MIAKQIVDRFIQGLLLGTPMPIPTALWAAALGPQSERLPRVPLLRSEWQWIDGAAVYRGELAFAPLADGTFEVNALTLYDAESGGSEVATFVIETEILNKRGILEIPAGALVVKTRV